MAWIGAAIGAAGGLLGGMMNSSSASQINQQNIALAEQEEQWQTQMSNTAEQRHVADLESAGLNPALAYGTPAPVPSQAPLPQLTNPRPGDAVSAMVQNGVTAYQAQAQVGAANAQAAAAQGQARLNNAQAANVEATAPYAGATAQSVLDNNRRQNDLLFQQANNLNQQFQLNEQMNPLQVKQLSTNTEFQRSLLELQKSLQQYEVTQSALGISKAQADSDFFSTPWGKRIAPFLNNGGGTALGTVGNAASKIGGMF